MGGLKHEIHSLPLLNIASFFLFKRSFLYRVKPLSKLWFYNKSKREALEWQRKRKSENQEGQFQEIKSNRIGLSPLHPKFEPIGFKGWNQDRVSMLRS